MADQEWADEAEYMAHINTSLRRPDAQEFMQVYNLGAAELGTVRVWYRQIVGDFMAECAIRRDGQKRSRRLTAVGEGRTEALEALAAAVAAKLYPVKEPA